MRYRSRLDERVEQPLGGHPFDRVHRVLDIKVRRVRVVNLARGDIALHDPAGMRREVPQVKTRKTVARTFRGGLFEDYLHIFLAAHLVGQDLHVRYDLKAELEGAL